MGRRHTRFKPTEGYDARAEPKRDLDKIDDIPDVDNKSKVVSSVTDPTPLRTNKQIRSLLGRAVTRPLLYERMHLPHPTLLEDLQTCFVPPEWGI